MRRSLLLGLMVTLLLSVSLVAGQDATPEAVQTGTLSVSDTLPEDGATDIATNAEIVVIFNRPVVPLGTIETMAAYPGPIQISPAADGEGAWLNTSIYTFRPSALAGGTRYTVAVDPSLTAVDGSPMAGPYSFSFTTAAPAVTGVSPADLETGVELDRSVQVTFNMPVDQAAAEAGFSLSTKAGDTVAGSFEWSDDGLGFRFSPAQRLLVGETYTARIASGAVTSAGGGQPMADALAWAFETVPLPAIISTYPADGDVFIQDFYRGATLFFASPMDLDSLDGAITIDPAPAREYDSYWSDYDNSYSLSFPMEPSTDYSITIAPGMRDIYGNTIDEGRTIRFSTGPYPPELQLQAPGPIGFYNAYNPSTGLFTTSRNVSQLNLALYDLPVSQAMEVFNNSSWSALTDVRLAPDQLLRRWSVPFSDVPENALRYELLNLGQAGGAADCPSAPPTRLQVGDVATVITDPDPVRARTEPVSGEIVDLLYRDYRLPIVGGPVCAGDMLWWQVSLRDETVAWVAEGVTEEYYLDVALEGDGAPAPARVYATEEGALLPGLYVLEVSTPETLAQGYLNQRHLLVVGTTSLNMYTSQDQVTVWATDAQTGDPVANAPITIYDSANGPIASGATDEDGVLTLNVPLADSAYTARYAVLNADGQFGVGFNQWTDGIDPYYFGVMPDYAPVDRVGYLYTDRPIYRPGQPVYFRGIMRQKDDVRYLPPNADSVAVAIYNDQGDVVYEDTLPLSEFGSFNGTFQLDPAASLGYYRLVAELPGRELDEWSSPQVTFGVAEYRAPEFQVNVTAAAPEVAQGDDIDLTIDARYFFGGPVSGGTVTYTVVSAPYFFDYQGPGSYSFQDDSADAGPGEALYDPTSAIASGEGTLDSQGRLTLTIPAQIEDASQSQTFTIEATVSDESGLSVSGRTDVIVHKGEVYAGVQPESYVANAGQPATVNLIAVDWDSQPVANQTIQVEAVERRWSSVQEQDEYGRTTWTYDVEDIPVTTGEVTTDANGRAQFTFTPPNGGSFRIRATLRDDQGGESSSAAYLWVSSSDYVSWRQQNSNRIDLIADKDEYAIGDTAQILITSPFQGASEALVVVQRGDVLETHRLTMDSNSQVFELPITEDYAPNVYVGVFITHGVDEANPVTGFRAGLIELGVERDRQELTVEVKPQTETAGPGDTVTYTVRTTDYAGRPVEAEVGIGLSDLATLSIAEPNSGSLMDFFYGPQGLGVLLSSPLAVNADQITQTILDTIKGGGGGFGEGGIFDIRQEFIDTPYWNPTLVTNADGTAEFSVTLPDNLTTWRLDARAVSLGADGDLLVGQTTDDLLSTKPVLIRPVTPRFFVVGDQVTLAAIVNNNTEADLSVDVTLEASGVTPVDASAATQTVSIPAGGRARVEWPVTVDDAESADLTFYASANDGAYTDASRPPLGQGDARLLPIARFEVPQTTATAGVVPAGESREEAVLLPTEYPVVNGSLDVRLDHSLAGASLAALDVLKNFPHQCIEQTVSRFLPNIMTVRALQAAGIDDTALSTALDTSVNEALQMLVAQQKVDGGWGWFVQDRSDSLVTAWALIGLREALTQGYAVNGDIIRDAADFVLRAISEIDQGSADWELNRLAFLNYALSQAGRPDAAAASNLYEYRSRLDHYALALLALTLHAINPDDARIDTLMSDLASAAVLSATGAYWDEADDDRINWNTDTRSTAIILDAFSRIAPDNALTPNIVRWLMSARTADAWETTQETAWAVMALSDWMTASGELNGVYDYTVTLNDAPLGEGSVDSANIAGSQVLSAAVSDLLADQANALRFETQGEAGTLYYSAYLNADVPVPDVEPVDRGIILQRSYTRQGDETRTPIDTAAVGENIEVRLTIIVPNDLNYAVIEDRIPAGAEAVNPNLLTSQQVGTQPEFTNTADPLSQGWGWWWFSSIDFYDDRVALYAQYLPAGTYEFVYTMRAGLPGVFNVIPATGQEFYFPEVYGRTAGDTFTITPAE